MGLIRTINNGYAEYSAAVGFIHLAELETLPRNVTIGSIVHVIETGERYILDDTKTWCLLNLGCGGSSGGLKYTVVEELPSIDQAEQNTIYMIKNGDHYDYYIKSGDTYIQLGDSIPIPENLVTLDDLADYVKKTELTDGSIMDIIVSGSISAPEFIEDGVSLEDKYLQKADLESGTVNFKNINAENVFVTNKITGDNVEIKDAIFDNVTINKLLKLAFGASVEGHKWSISQDGDILCDSLSVDNADGITIADENIYEYVKRIAKQYGGGGSGGGGIDEDELKRLLPTILNKPPYQADFTETDSTKPSYIWHTDKVWTTDDMWIGTQAEYDAVKDTIPAGVHILITDDDSGDPTNIQEVVLDYSDIADITDDEKEWVDDTSNGHILELILNNYRNIQANQIQYTTFPADAIEAVIPSNASSSNQLATVKGSVDRLMPRAPWIEDNFNNAKIDDTGVAEFTVLNSAANTPALGANYVVIYTGFSATLGRQFAMQNGDTATYTRSRTGADTWSAWQALSPTSTVASGSTAPITSGGVYSALNNKTSVTATSANNVYIGNSTIYYYSQTKRMLFNDCAFVYTQGSTMPAGKTLCTITIPDGITIPEKGIIIPAMLSVAATNEKLPSAVILNTDGTIVTTNSETNYNYVNIYGANVFFE